MEKYTSLFVKEVAEYNTSTKVKNVQFMGIAKLMGKLIIK